MGGATCAPLLSSVSRQYCASWAAPFDQDQFFSSAALPGSCRDAPLEEIQHRCLGHHGFRGRERHRPRTLLG